MLLWTFSPLGATWQPDGSGNPVWNGDPGNPADVAPEGGPDWNNHDADTLPNWYEDFLGTDKYNPDSDGDLVTDSDELTVTLTDPLNADTNGNGRTDLEDWVLFTSPGGDYDNDGLPNSAEIASTLTGWRWESGGMVSFAYTPSMLRADTNSDGWTDGEDDAGLSAPTADPDNDGLTNAQEAPLGTSPKNPDTDGDGLSDSFEMQTSCTDPLVADSNGNGRSDSDDHWNPLPPDPGANPDPDSDGDGLTDSHESSLGTDASNPDSDGDGLSDGFEVNHASYTNLAGQSATISPLTADSDGDGLGDHAEIYTYGTSPAHADTDGDGLSDSFEVQTTFTNAGNPDSDGNGRSDYEDHYNPVPTDPDNDGDGLTASQESTLGTDPANADSDGDALPDGHEVNVTQTHPLLADTDGDGLSDSAEWSQYGTNPNQADTDSDTMSDGDEVAQGRDPLVIQDTDGDGLPDHLETSFHGTDPLVADTDSDGLSDGQEVSASSGYTTNPLVPDTDGDSLSDGFETDPSHASDPTAADTDNDGLNDAEELSATTNPLAADTDTDGLTDYEELHIYTGVSPLNAHSLSTLYTDWHMVDTTDSDGGGIPDRIEQFYGMNAWDAADETTGDLDSDGVSNLTAYQNGWNLTANLYLTYDDDADGMTNVWEIAHGLNPADPTDAHDDPDGDFLLNVEEYTANTDPALLLTFNDTGVWITPPVPPDAPEGYISQGRMAANDYEVVMLAVLPTALLRDNGPDMEREHDDDWDLDGGDNHAEMTTDPATDPRSWDSFNPDWTQDGRTTLFMDNEPPAASAAEAAARAAAAAASAAASAALLDAAAVTAAQAGESAAVEFRVAGAGLDVRLYDQTWAGGTTTGAETPADPPASTDPPPADVNLIGPPAGGTGEDDPPPDAGGGAGTDGGGAGAGGTESGGGGGEELMRTFVGFTWFDAGLRIIYTDTAINELVRTGHSTIGELPLSLAISGGATGAPANAGWMPWDSAGVLMNGREVYGSGVWTTEHRARDVGDGNWVPFDVHFANGGAQEYRLRRTDTSVEGMKQRISRTFLVVKTVAPRSQYPPPGTPPGSQEITPATLTIEPGELVSGSGTGTYVSGGTIRVVALPPSEIEHRVTFGLAPIEVLQPSIQLYSDASVPVDQETGKVLTGDLEPVGAVRFCRWWGAYPNGSPYTLDPGFIDEDPDRFVIRIPASIAVNKTTIKAQISTKAPEGMTDGAEYEDDATEITLTKDSTGNWFQSNPMIMVTDKDDANEAVTGITKAENNTEDATHVGWMGGKIEVEIPEINNAKFLFGLAKPKRKITVEAAIVDAQGASSFASVKQAFDKAKKRAKEIYCQHLIEMEFTKAPTNIPFTGKVFDSLKTRSDASGTLIDLQGNLEWRFESLLTPNTMLLDAEAREMLDEIATQTGWSNDVVKVVYLPFESLSHRELTQSSKIHDGSPLGVTLNSQTTTDFGFTHNFSPHEDVVLLSSRAESLPMEMVLAHEIGHALNLTHFLHPPPGNPGGTQVPWHRLMLDKAGGSAAQPLLTKRIWPEESKILLQSQ